MATETDFMSSIASIVAELISIVGLAMNSPAMVVSEPVIRQLDAGELQHKVCGKPCRVLAWYGPDGVIYIDNRVDPKRNIVAKGILLHELVHHVQREARGGNSSNCVEWLRRERQAYRIQAQWLFDNGIDASPLIWQVRTVRCNPDAFGKR
jgi:hypothetical protein